MTPGSGTHRQSGGGTRSQLLLYVNQIYPDETTAEAVIERDLLAAMRKRVEQDPDARVVVFTVHGPGGRQRGWASGLDEVTVGLNKSKRTGYIAHQVRLLVALLRVMVRHRHEEISIYLRHSVSSIAPVLLATLFNRRLMIRTGPVLANLAIYGKRPGHLGYQAIRFGFWWNCRKARAILVVTETTKRWIARTYPFATRKIIVVPNAVDVSQFPIFAPDRARWGLAEGGLVLGFIGYLYEDQGVDTVIRALAKLHQEMGSTPQLLVVGDGPCLESLMALARSVGVDPQVVFAGRRPHSEIASAIATCDVMLAPFTRRLFAVAGSSAMKLFEYLACDKPVLASRGEDHQFLADRGLGWLVEPEDVDAWAAAIRERMNHPSSINLQGRGRELVEQAHSYDAMAQQIWSACFASG